MGFIFVEGDFGCFVVVDVGVCVDEVEWLFVDVEYGVFVCFDLFVGVVFVVDVVVDFVGFFFVV